MKPTPRQQQVFDMRESGMTCREVAEALGISEQATKDYYHQARRRLGVPIPENLSAAAIAAKENREAIYAAIQATAMTSNQLVAAFPHMSAKQVETAVCRLAEDGFVRSYRRSQARVWAADVESAEVALDSLYRMRVKSAQMLREAAKRQRAAEEAERKERQKVRKQMEAKALQAQTVNIVQSRPGMAGVTIQAAKGGEAIITERTLITVIPTPPGRFEVDIPRGKGAISSDWKARRLSEVQACGS